MTTASPARSRYGVFAAVSALLFVTVVPACHGLGSRCADFCDSWHDCVDATISSDNCEDACHDWADGNDDREAKVKACADCVNDNDEVCSETKQRCAADCLGIPVRK